MNNFLKKENKEILKLKVNEYNDSIYHNHYSFNIDNFECEIVVRYFKAESLSSFTLSNLINSLNKVILKINNYEVFEFNFCGFPGFCHSAILFNCLQNIYMLEPKFQIDYNKYKKQITTIVFNILRELLFTEDFPILYYKREIVTISDKEGDSNFSKVFDYSVLNYKILKLGENPNTHNNTYLITINL